MLGRIITVMSLLAFLLLAALLLTTQPSTVGPLGILFVFILMYVLALGVLTFLIYGVSAFVVKSSIFRGYGHPIERLSLGRSYYYATALALAPVILIGMQSVGEVGVYDVLLVVFFEFIACVYITKRSN